MTPAQAIVLRHAGAEDADAIAGLHTESWRRTYRGMMSDDFLDHRALGNRRLTWRERLDSPPPNQYVRVAVAPTALVGFICAFADHDPVWGSYIDNLHVIAGMHRQGIGRALMRDVAGWLSQVRPDRGVWLWVMEANTSARAFYERLGATNAGTADLRDPDGGHAPNCRYVWPRPSLLVPQEGAQGAGSSGPFANDARQATSPIVGFGVPAPDRRFPFVQHGRRDSLPVVAARRAGRSGQPRDQTGTR